MSPHLLRAALCAGPIAFLALNSTQAHEIVGNRMFPATIAIDDPGVADALSFPTVAISKSGDVPPVKQIDISGEDSTELHSSHFKSQPSYFPHVPGDDRHR